MSGDAGPMAASQPASQPSPARLLQPRRFHPLKAAWVLFVLVVFAVYTTRRDRPLQAWKAAGQVMGSTYAFQVVDRGLDQSSFETLREIVDRFLQGLNQELSTWDPHSPVSAFNASASTDPFPVPPSVAELTRLSLDVSRLSGGIFDITLSPLFDLWGFGKEGPRRVPDDKELAVVRARCGYPYLSVPGSNVLQKAIPGLRVAYNAIAPGYAADQVTALLRQQGYTNTYVDVGGETVVQGHNAQGHPWRIGIETPQYDVEPGSSLEAVVHLAHGALATSGDYRKYFRDDSGRVFSHIFDPRTGRPATTRVASVSVVAPSGAMADALATTLFVMGPGEGLPWLAANLPGVEALFILRETENTFSEVATPGFEKATGYRPRTGAGAAP